MTGEILQAVLDECRAVVTTKFGEDIGTLILKTDYRPENLPSYQMPVLLLDLMDGPESGQYVGGLTRMDWIFAMNSYNYEPNVNVDSDLGYATSLLNITDTVRRHFSFGVWLTAGMSAILDAYGFRFTLSGLLHADALEADGVVMGYKIVFESISFDQVTQDVAPSTSVLEYVVDLDGDNIS